MGWVEEFDLAIEETGGDLLVAAPMLKALVFSCRIERAPSYSDSAPASLCRLQKKNI
jgi:hypothetical protein